MSLTDALLLDPARLDLWIALRPDGVTGSGTEADPYNGSPRFEAALAVSTLAKSGREATVTTTADHGYFTDDVVTISGVTGTGAPYYNGTFVIDVVDSKTFTYWMLADPGAAAAGTITCARTWFRFDEIMAFAAANTTIHLGPGVFPTLGHGQAGGLGWAAKTGQKIIGSGIDVTVVKLVCASVAGSMISAIGTSSYLDSFEASDFTVDCNLGGQAIAGNAFAPVACGAVFVLVQHIRLRRIRAINFGTLYPNLECFVFIPTAAYAGATEAVDCIIEDCIIENPSINNGAYNGPVTCILMAAGEASDSGVAAFHRSCIIRNCLIDCEYKDNPVPIQSISISGTTATVRTRLPHGRQTSAWVAITGAQVNGSTDNTYNGSYPITKIDDYQFSYTPYDDPGGGHPKPTVDAMGDMWVGRFSSHIIQVTSIVKTGTGPYTITVTTSTPHFRLPGNNVLMNQAVPADYNGSFEVKQVLNPFQFTFEMQSVSGSPGHTGNEFIGVTFQAISGDAGTAAVVEGNRVLNTRIGGPYHDTYTTKDIVIRNNHFRAVVTGPFQNLGELYGFQVSRTTDLIPVSLTHSGSIAIATTTHAHGFAIGNKVIIAGATGADAGFYNSPTTPAEVPFAITDVTTTIPYQFRYQMSATPSGNAQGSTGYATADAKAYRQRLLESLNYALENGVYVATAQIRSGYSAHGFIQGDGVKVAYATEQTHNEYFNDYHTITSVPSQTTFKFNLPGNPDPPSGDSGSSPSGYYGRLWQAGRMVIEDNVIELIPTPAPWGSPAAILLGYGTFVSAPLFRQVVIRRNVIRHVENASDPAGMPPGMGIVATGCGGLIVEENVIDLDEPNSIAYSYCDKVRFFNNRTSAGLLIQGVDSGTANKASELTTDIEDAAMLAL